MLVMEEPDEDVLAITRLQIKNAIYLDPHTEERFREAKADVEWAMVDERRVSIEVASTLVQPEFEKNIVQQVL